MKKLRIILAFALAIVLLLPAAVSAAQSTDGAVFPELRKGAGRRRQRRRGHEHPQL